MELKDGEVICSKCHGKGVTEVNKNQQSFTCGKCGGEGKTDWITNIMPRRFSLIKPGVYIQEVDYSIMIPIDKKERS